jgi:preprotein translocase subunit SecD
LGRAWLSIRDSNSSSLITTLILYIFGSPSIKGFAITLSIGIVISMFTAITISRTLLKLFIGQKLAKFSWLYGAKTINPATAK